MSAPCFPGKGCECNARSEAECGCDADWTPSEVYTLRAKVEELRLQLNEALRGLRLMAQNAELWKERAENAEKELRELLQSIHVTDKIPNENYHPQYGGTSLL